MHRPLTWSHVKLDADKVLGLVNQLYNTLTSFIIEASVALRNFDSSTETPVSYVASVFAIFHTGVQS